MKYLASLVVAVLTATALNVTAGAPAHSGGYAPTIRTFCDAFATRNPIRAGQRAATKYRVRAEDGRRPDASIAYTISKRSGSVVASASRSYTGGTDRITSPELRRGKYVVSVSASPTADRYFGCSAQHGVRVKKRRR